MTPADRADLRITYVIEGTLSFAANLIFIGIFYYTAKVFGWSLVHNFCLAAAQGAAYVVAALLSQRLAKALGGRRLMIAANIALAAVSLAACFCSDPVP